MLIKVFYFVSLQGDTVVIHLYVKNINQQLLSVILFEEELQVKFATRFDSNVLTLQIVNGLYT